MLSVTKMPKSEESKTWLSRFTSDQILKSIDNIFEEDFQDCIVDLFRNFDQPFNGEIPTGPAKDSLLDL